MGHALIASFGGIPLLYMGDEIGLLNDYGYEQIRPPATTAAGCTARRWTGTAPRAATSRQLEGRIYSGLRHILDRRRADAGDPRRQSRR